MRAPRRAPGRRGRGRRAAGGAIRDGGTFDGHRTREGRHGGDARGCERDVAQHSSRSLEAALVLFFTLLFKSINKSVMLLRPTNWRRTLEPCSRG